MCDLMQNVMKQTALDYLQSLKRYSEPSKQNWYGGREICARPADKEEGSLHNTTPCLPGCLAKQPDG